MCLLILNSAGSACTAYTVFLFYQMQKAPVTTENTHISSKGTKPSGGMMAFVEIRRGLGGRGREDPA
eukprot:scaffold54188_cov19-Tisochrysis_lutea.AAC.1